jgi:L-cysteine S-thiosulfotransferase
VKPAVRYALTAAAIALTGWLAACGTPPSSELAAANQDAQAMMKKDFAALGPQWLTRLDQDEVQATCSRYRDAPPPDVAAQIQASQMRGVVFPPADKLSGDWKRGEAIAQLGRGLQFSDPADAPVGGNCYACHQLSVGEISYGTIGPSLLHYGKLRGNSTETQRYTWGKIYNAEAYAACSNMPRFGHNGVLTAEQIADLVALLLDPASPVNQ